MEIQDIPARIGHGFKPIEILPISYLERPEIEKHKRLRVFAKKGLECVIPGCERVGEHVIITEDDLGHKHVDVYTKDFHLMTVDHIVPKSLGGSNALKNLQPMCSSCNSRKSNKMPDNFDYTKTVIGMRIADHVFDKPDSEFTFSQRLADENLWTHEYALRVIEEYRRFCYMSKVVKHQVTPSDQVDQAWHLHLLYTRDYAHFCSNVLQGKLHHGPTKGGQSETNRFEDQYCNTLQSYERLFGCEAPLDIWPKHKERFSGNFARVDLAKHLVIHIPSFPRLSRMFRWVLNCFV